MKEGYELLTEKEEMWARMLMQVLKDNDIPCAVLPVHGGGFVLKTGMQDTLRVYVPSEKLQHAKELLQELFSGEPIEE